MALTNQMEYLNLALIDAIEEKDDESREDYQALLNIPTPS